MHTTYVLESLTAVQAKRTSCTARTSDLWHISVRDRNDKCQRASLIQRWSHHGVTWESHARTMYEKVILSRQQVCQEMPHLKSHSKEKLRKCLFLSYSAPMAAVDLGIHILTSTVYKVMIHSHLKHGFAMMCPSSSDDGEMSWSTRSWKTA
jgi:hypothetical protein